MAKHRTASEVRARDKVAAANVHRELIDGQSTDLLRELHLLTRRGDLNADARRKLKQINHYCGLLRPELEPLFADGNSPVLVDAGAGNAYLGFILYEVFLQKQGAGHIVNVDRRNDLVQRGESRAGRLGFSRMHFTRSSVAELLPGMPADDAPSPPTALPWSPTGKVDAVISLHACDTATDEAILLGLQTQAPFIALVPCCQAEVFNLLKGKGRGQNTHPLWRHAWHRREFGAHLTNVIRALVLEAFGYKVRVTELAGWEHSLKNELIMGRRHQRASGAAMRQLRQLLSELPPLDMMLLRELGLTTGKAETSA
ncbi:MAG: SAM-dependent methyltransferase [Myxococcales bacterium]|nr:SAM-dependent methyltransferase [Myxococcales bacterium]